MLSYQHAYHAGNLADVHKHAVLAVALDYMAQKDKPLTYIESHAGRGLYDLDSAEAVKTGEAAQGIDRVADWFAAEHPYTRALAACRARHGARTYPGSPLIAASLLPAGLPMHLADLHPAEHGALARLLPQATVRHEDGVAMALSITPPTPRRGLMLIDPAYEVKDDYATMATLLPQLHRRWNVGVLILWYPILDGGMHAGMTGALRAAIPDITLHQVRFPPARPGHRMVGSGLALINAPYGVGPELDRLSMLYGTL
jgi:23S rRNA (adenine2030-N6)-methyltransferase